jgi:ATP-binding cassette subfamily B protein
MGDILAHFSSDVASVEGLLNMAVPVGVAAFLGILINLVIIFILEWMLAILALGGLLLCSFSPYIFNSRATAANYLLKKKQAELLSVVEENIGAQKVVKSFNLHNTVLQDFHKKPKSFAE